MTLITAPAQEPLSVSDIKGHTKIEVGEEDGQIETWITAARQWAENYTKRSFINQVWEGYLLRFPDEIEIPRPPLVSVDDTEFKYFDINGAEQVVTSSIYQVDTTGTSLGRVYLDVDQSWPSVRAQEKAIKMRFTAGYGTDQTDVPEAIRHAMRLYIGHLSENRESVVFSVGGGFAIVPDTVTALLLPYRAELAI